MQPRLTTLLSRWIEIVGNHGSRPANNNRLEGLQGQNDPSRVASVSYNPLKTLNSRVTSRVPPGFQGCVQLFEIVNSRVLQGPLLWNPYTPSAQERALGRAQGRCQPGPFRLCSRSVATPAVAGGGKSPLDGSGRDDDGEPGWLS
jgi:hypothetical protein